MKLLEYEGELEFLVAEPLEIGAPAQMQIKGIFLKPCSQTIW